MSALHVLGPLRVGAFDVVMRANSATFASVAKEVFVDLSRPPDPQPTPPVARTTVVFDAIVHLRPTLHWSVHRDGKPCELQLRDDAVMVHLQWELNRLVIESQRAVIHAAAVARDGKAVLLAGQSHSGKTTLAAWLTAHHGFDYLTDEASAVNERGEVRSYPRPLGLRPGGPMSVVVHGDGRRFMPEEVLVPASTLGATVSREAAHVELVVFPRFRAGGEVTVTALSQADTVERLAHLTPGLVRHGHEVFSRLTRLVSTAAALEVTYPNVCDATAVLLAHPRVR